MNIEYKFNKEELKNIAICVSDLDGTLLNEKSSLSKETIIDVKRYKDRYPFILASGRNYPCLIQFFEDLKLNTPIITLNGSCTFFQNEIINSITIDKICQTKIFDILQLFPIDNLSINLFTGKEWYTNSLSNYYIQREMEIVNKKPSSIKTFDNLRDMSINKLMIMGEYSTIVDIKKKLDTLQNDIFVVHNYKTYLEIFSKNASKGNAIKFVCNKFNYNINEIVTCGDTQIDIPMLSLTKYKAVPISANEEILKYANIILPSYKENAVGTLLKDILSIKGDL